MKNEQSRSIFPDYKKLHLTFTGKKETGEKEAEKYYREGRDHLKNHRIHDALTAFQKALEWNPDMMRAHKKLAGIYKETGDRYSAAACYRELLRLDEKNREAQDFLLGFYTDTKKMPMAADILKIQAGQEKKREKKTELLHRAAGAYFQAEDYPAAREVYRSVLREEIYNPEIFNKLKNIYQYEQNHSKWKVCEQILLLNNRITSEAKTDRFKLITSHGPVTAEIYDRLVHPGESAFKKYFGWMKPMFKLMEPSTPPEILRLSESVAEDTREFGIFKECCHYLNMELPPLRHYKGPARFKFIADPLEDREQYCLIYNDAFMDQLNDAEKIFLLSNHLTIIKGGFISLLNLSVSDVARMFMEIAAIMFSFLTIFQGIPLDKAAKVVKKTPKTGKAFDLLNKLQKKLLSFKLLGRSTGEMEVLMKKSVEMLPDKVESEEGFNYRNLMNRKFLESALLGFYFTADRVSYYLVRDLVDSSRALFHLLAGKDALERVEKFGLAPYINDTRNQALKQRLAELFLFAIDFDPAYIERGETAGNGEKDGSNPPGC